MTHLPEEVERSRVHDITMEDLFDTAPQGERVAACHAR